jgi:hypothetical protein
MPLQKSRYLEMMMMGNEIWLFIFQNEIVRTCSTHRINEKSPNICRKSSKVKHHLYDFSKNKMLLLKSILEN